MGDWALQLLAAVAFAEARALVGRPAKVVDDAGPLALARIRLHTICRDSFVARWGRAVATYVGCWVHEFCPEVSGQTSSMLHVPTLRACSVPPTKCGQRDSPTRSPPAGALEAAVRAELRRIGKSLAQTTDSSQRLAPPPPRGESWGGDGAPTFDVGLEAGYYRTAAGMTGTSVRSLVRIVLPVL